MAPQFDPSKPFTTFDLSQPFTFEPPSEQIPFSPDKFDKTWSAEDFTDADHDGRPDNQQNWWTGVKDAAGRWNEIGGPKGLWGLAKAIYTMQPGNMDFEAKMRMTKEFTDSQVAELKKGKAEWDKGNHSAGVGHMAAGMFPFVGPIAGETGEDIANQRWGKATGDVVGLATPEAIARGGPAAMRGAREVGAAIAPSLDRMATNKLVKQMVPRSGGASAERVALGAEAAEVAPDLLRDQVTNPDGTTQPLPNMSAASRPGLHDKINTALTDATAELDAVYDKIPVENLFETKPVVEGVTKKLGELQVKGVNEAEVTSGRGKNKKVSTVTADTSVEPSTHKARGDVIRQGLEELKALGSKANIQNLRKLAQAWGEGARPVYEGRPTPEAMGFADLERTLRDYIVEKAPETAPANAKYSLLQQAADVMAAAEKVDRVRQPSTLRTMTTEALGAGLGHVLTGGRFGAAVGAALAPIVDAALAGGYTMQIGLARKMARMADAMAKGRPAVVQSSIMDAARTAGVKIEPSILDRLRKGRDDERGFALVGDDRRGPNRAKGDTYGALLRKDAAAPDINESIRKALGRISPDELRKFDQFFEEYKKENSPLNQKIDAELDKIADSPEDLDAQARRVAADSRITPSYDSRELTPEQRTRMGFKGEPPPTERMKVNWTLKLHQILWKQGIFPKTRVQAVQLRNAIDDVLNVGRDTSTVQKGGMVANTAREVRATSKEIPRTFEQFVKNVHASMPFYGGSSTGGAALKSKIGAPEFMRLIKELSEGKKAEKAMDPAKITGKILDFGDGREIWRTPEGKVVVKAKGAERALTDAEEAIVTQHYPWIKKGSL